MKSAERTMERSTSCLRSGSCSWEEMRETPLLHWNMLEAYVAGFSFMIWIIVYRLLDRVSFLQKYKFYSYSTDEISSSWMGSFDYRSWLPLFLYLASIHIYHLFIIKPPVTMESPTWERLLIEVISGIILYDFIFYWIHYLMHITPSFNFLHQHSIHHTHTRLCASIVQQHSLMDAFFQVFVNILVQNISIFYPKKHIVSRLLHNILITYMLTEIHAGYDGPWCLHNLFPSLIGGAACHEVHHHSGKGNYQQFFYYLDYIMGTYRAPHHFCRQDKN